MMTRMVMCLVLLTWHLACGGSDADIESTKSDLDKGLEEPGQLEISNMMNPPPVNREGFKPQHAAMPVRVKREPMGTRGRIFETEVIVCDDSSGKTVCATETSRQWPDGTELTEEDLKHITFPGQVEGVDGQPPNYWAGDVAATAAIKSPAVATSVSPLAVACNGLPDECNTCFTPECWGGGTSPGGIAETATGCHGTSINYGGPSCTRPDNANVTVSFWGGLEGSCNDLTFEGFPQLKWVVDWLNGQVKVLPDPFVLVPTRCNAITQLPPGYMHDIEIEGVPSITPGPQAEWGSQVDIMVQYGKLDPDTIGLWGYCPYLNRGPGYNAADRRVMGCTHRTLELDSSDFPRTRSWNNGKNPSQLYYTMRGALITVDPDTIGWYADRPTSELDRGNYSRGERMAFLYSHTLGHEIGHSIGLTHSYIGAKNTNRWLSHSHLPGSFSVNPNLFPYSVMASVVPAAPYTLIGWSSGMRSNMQTYDIDTSGNGNAEGWRLSNAFRTVYTSDGTAVPQNRYAPPMSATNNEL